MRCVGCVLLCLLGGCVLPTEFATDVFADVSDGRLIVALNLVGQGGKRFVIYRSEMRDLTRWTLLGTYWGRIEAAAASGNRLWAFFDGSVLRRYQVSERSTDGPSAVSDQGADTIDGVPFDWRPVAACSDQSSIWVVGIEHVDEKDRIVVARNVADRALGWQLIFPLGPTVISRRGQGSEAPSRSSEREDQHSDLVTRVRSYACGDLYVFWSIAQPAETVASKIHGARLVLSGKEGVYWRELPTFVFEHEDFCAAPGPGGRPGLVLREHHASRARKPRHLLLRTELDETARWREPYAVTSATQKLLVGYIPCCAWVTWDKGELLVRSDTQRVELLKHDEGRWQRVMPPGVPWFMLHLADIQVMVLFAGAVVLVVAGSAAFAIRFVRLRRAGSARTHHSRHSGRGTAPIAARAVAGAFDLILVGTLVLRAVGMPGPSPDPLVPGLRPLLPYVFVLGALVLYGTLLEAWLGATIGKLAIGLRVADLDGGPPGLLRALVRNLLKPVDIFPMPTGALGLSLMILTPSRKRLGDIAAGTTVLTAPPPPRGAAGT